MERNIPVFRVLGIGSGDGKPDLEILHAVARSLLSSGDENQKPLMHLCIVEPSSSLIADFKQAVSPLPEKVATLADVSFNGTRQPSRSLSRILCQIGANIT